ncbi:MAG: GC-type dockerin domain-anchored protein [Phycisphaerales bacterium]
MTTPRPTSHRPAALLAALALGSGVLGFAADTLAQGGSLTTTFAGGFNSGGAFFNLSTNRPGGVWLRTVQVQVTAPTGINLCGSLFYRPGGFAGHTTSAAGWERSYWYPPCQTINSAGLPTQWNIHGINLHIPDGVTMGMLLHVDGPNPAGRLAWTSIPPAAPSYTNGGLTLTGGEAVTGAFSAPTIPGAMINITMTYSHTGPSCYANCVGDSNSPWLNVNDFACFINMYANGSEYANCDQSTTPPILNVNDFVCFLNAFVAGCSAP